jgi:hypothetical protein
MINTERYSFITIELKTALFIERNKLEKKPLKDSKEGKTGLFIEALHMIPINSLMKLFIFLSMISITKKNIALEKWLRSLNLIQISQQRIKSEKLNSISKKILF